MAPDSFSSFVTVLADYVVQKPEHLSFAEAASIPSAFVTAFYGSARLGEIATGDRVRSTPPPEASGLAAVQIAQQAGAEIFGHRTGNPEKRAFLKSIGVQHVLDLLISGLCRGDQLALTNGQGIDLVLNSLSGDFITKSVELLGEDGIFVEIGNGASGAMNRSLR